MKDYLRESFSYFGLYWRMLRARKHTTPVYKRFGSDKEQYFLCYKPEMIRSDKVIIWVHGGGWNAGNPRFFDFVGQSVSKEGYLMVSLGYRLSPGNKYPAQIEDVAQGFNAAIRYLKEKNIDTSKVIVAGPSAGAHLTSILCYSKNQSILGFPNGIDPNASENSKIFNSEIRNTVVKNGSKNPMSVITLPKGFPCAVDTMEIQEHYDSFPHYHSKAIIKNGRLQNNVNVESGWSSKNILLAFINNKFEPVLDTKQQLTTFEITHTGAIEMIKQREHKSHVLSVLSNLGSTQNMSNELARMNIKFDFPKPLELLKYLIGFYAENHDIILDSFAGSGTTAHAVLSLNKKDNGNRKFILVEMMDYAESITAERVKRVIDGYGEGNKVVPGTGGSFTFYELGEKLFNEDGNLNAAVPAEKIREYVWYMETRMPLPVSSQVTENNMAGETDRCIVKDNAAFLGVCNHTAYYFHYSPESATTLDHDFLSTIKTKAESYVIYADACALGEGFLTKHHITFKKIPRDIERL